MSTGKEILTLAETRLGEKYQNGHVPKDNPNWHGPWDCAELAAWVVYQVTGQLYGCLSNSARPAMADAYSGSWARDVDNGTLLKTTRATANNTPGVILIRKPPYGEQMGHIAISDGKGRTVEAAGKRLGVCRRKVEGRDWDYFALIPNVTYVSTGVDIPAQPLPHVIKLQHPYITGPKVKEIQQRLLHFAYNPGEIDGVYGPHTVAAVYAFQKAHALVADGVVGALTAKKLGISWP
jgi:N-acetylmuramoyl-L-alanine amidase